MDRYMIPKLKHLAGEVGRQICPCAWEVTGLCCTEQDDPAFAAPGCDDSAWQPLRAGQPWGGYDRVLWVRGVLEIPPAQRGQPLDLQVDMSDCDGCDTRAESLLYLDGVETHGLDNWHNTVRLEPQQTQRPRLCLALRCWSGLWAKPRRFAGAWLRQVEVPAEKLYHLARILIQTAEQLDPEDRRRLRLLQCVDEAFHTVDFRAPQSHAFYASAHDAWQQLRRQVGALALDGADKPLVAVIGHTHIDMAWLWRLCHTREKAARSFSTVLHLMERYPQYRFSQSSPLVYEMIRTKYPGLFARIQQKVAEGRWEVTGGMWVEADTNLPSGESLVRQILLGKLYMRKMFGVDCHVLWLPDVFGYSWVLPQLLKKSGFRLFWTNKLCWNQYDRFPYDTFWWRGVDGSQILAHLGTCPEKDVTWGGTYNGVIAPWEVKTTWDAYRQKDINDEVLLPFGYGDGGGGATREMLEAYDVMRDLPGLPRVEMRSCEEFACDLARNVQGKPVPVWDGELYFEYHRGTYTSQAAVKRSNRKAEVLYHDVEFLSAARDLLCRSQAYPARLLEENWKRILTNQFHDVLPGSGIRDVYRDARALYDTASQQGGAMLADAMAGIAEKIEAPAGSVVVFNTLPWKRDAILRLDAACAGKTLSADGELAEAQPAAQGTWVLLRDLPPMGYRCYRLADRPAQACVCPAFDGVLENRFYRICLNESGQITSLFDKEAAREVLEPGGLGNELRVYEDKPHQFSAWNTEIYAYEKSWPVTRRVRAELTECGPVRTVLEQEYRYGQSVIWQQIVLTGDRLIRFDTRCDWQEPDALLKACFPVEVRATHATYEMQFGNLERPTHSNTSWDYAQFEVCAHKWADLSEGNYGVALLNDCKYGCDIKGSRMRLTLIKTSHDPDPEADRGEHVFSYALLPHPGGWKDADVARAAYAFNYPVRSAAVAGGQAGGLPGEWSFADCGSRNVMLETVKRAEDGDGWILRLYEYMQCRGPVELTFARRVQSAEDCNLLEETQADLPVSADGRCVRFTVTPYEIKTLRVRFLP